MTTQEILKATLEAITRKNNQEEMISSLPDVTQFNTRFFVFYSGKSGNKEFDLPLWEIKTMSLSKNDALAKLLTNHVSDKICWGNVEEVASFMTANLMDAVYTLRIGDKNASSVEAREFPVYMEITKAGVFERLEEITKAVTADCNAVDANSPKFNLVSKHAKRGSEVNTTKGISLPDDVTL